MRPTVRKVARGSNDRVSASLAAASCMVHGAILDTRYSFKVQYSEESATMCPLPTSFRKGCNDSELSEVADFYNKKVV